MLETLCITSNDATTLRNVIIVFIILVIIILIASRVDHE
jgi:hypothetical protein